MLFLALCLSISLSHAHMHLLPWPAQQLRQPPCINQFTMASAGAAPAAWKVAAAAVFCVLLVLTVGRPPAVAAASGGNAQECASCSAGCTSVCEAKERNPPSPRDPDCKVSAVNRLFCLHGQQVRGSLRQKGMRVQVRHPALMADPILIQRERAAGTDAMGCLDIASIYACTRRVLLFLLFPLLFLSQTKSTPNKLCVLY